MSRNTRKQCVGKKRENVEIDEREKALRDLARDLHDRGWLDHHGLDLELAVFGVTTNTTDVTVTSLTALMQAS